ncbi:LIM and SH3 domain protein Lasp isoform X2 [Glossina fuscipes]|uniref:LIM and SH3 domain protein Lasp isoform X2 n=1 Tax=Glossina fuscipes TaxID=7396 RepID=A0A8U0W633_9MUSC|nr:LIM and SH3 domain protein Lasp isoform X2 [Glossina fuscipes]
MNKTCARCQKIVYPIEELKCLDKTWHKTCFKCTECGMALNMKTYKGFNKMPYCEAHIPKAKATVIADTPELKRIAENTKIQSNVKYHEDFEKAKGKFTQVADDPETLRIKQNTKIISNVAYHGDLEKKAKMEKQRGAAEISDIKANVNQSITHQQQQAQQQSQSAYQQPNNSYNQLRSAILQSAHHPTGGSNIDPALPSSTAATVSSYAYDQYDNSYARPSFQQNNNNNNSNVTNSTTTSSNVAASSTGYQPPEKQSFVVGGSSGSGGGYPINSNNSYSTQQLFASTNYNSYPSSATTLPPSPRSSFGVVGLASNGHNTHHTINGVGAIGMQHLQQQQQQQQQQHQNQNQHQHQHQQQQQQTSVSSSSSVGIVTMNGSGPQSVSAGNIGKIADYDPLTDGPRPLPNTARQSTTLIYSSDNRSNVNGIYGSLVAEQQAAVQQQQQQQQQKQQYYQQVQQQTSPQAQRSNHNLQQKQSKSSVRVYRALYDYEAQDIDEVSFREGDIIFEVEAIDSGWMTGRVERTGKTGMLPANYVEQAVI